jgi:hypothetical protein
VPPATGAYTIVLQDGNGQVLESQVFNAVFQVAHRTDPYNQVNFSQMLPFAPGTARIALQYQGNEVAAVTVSPNAPVVQVITPNAGDALDGTVNVTWIGTDADGNSLTYNVLYSADGGNTWTPLATDLTSSSFAWDTTQAAGTGSGQIMVVASDGVNNGWAVSGNFSVAYKNPSITITAPDDGSTVAAGQPVEFQASAYDWQDGEMNPGSLTFTSNRDGVLGTGYDVTVSTLSVGRHTITLT